jgi:hypothetical protein
VYEPFVFQCVIKPQYQFLKKGYETYLLDQGKPCQAGVTNQCAVRMSIALGRAGFGLEGFQPRSRVHAGVRCKTDGMAHVLGANELAQFLVGALFPPERFRESRRGQGCAAAFDSIQGRTGIVYFNNCFTRGGETRKVGDHIDLFNGQQYYNQVIRPQAGGNELSVGSLFAAADGVWFWALQ